MVTKQSTHLLFVLEIALIGKYLPTLQDKKAKKVCILMIAATLFIRAKDYKQSELQYR
jgi:hypothetical protein